MVWFVISMIKMFDLTSIEAKKFFKGENPPIEIRVESNASIISVRPIDKNNAYIDFRFTINYVNIGIINMEGQLIYEGDIEKVQESLKRQKNTPDEYTGEIFAAIVNTCTIEGVIISKEIRLPPPVPLPIQQINSKMVKKNEFLDYH
ncbi:MAG: hypothetical protein ACP5JT_03030 [Thermoplasmata archaeon]